MKKALFILLALVLVFAISCEPEHEHKFEEKVVDATCTTDGQKYKVCSCGAKTEVEKIPAKGHGELELKVEEPTEEKEGHYNYVCPVCKEVVKTEDIEKLLPGEIFVPYGTEPKELSAGDDLFAFMFKHLKNHTNEVEKDVPESFYNGSIKNGIFNKDVVYVDNNIYKITIAEGNGSIDFEVAGNKYSYTLNAYIEEQLLNKPSAVKDVKMTFDNTTVFATLDRYEEKEAIFKDFGFKNEETFSKEGEVDVTAQQVFKLCQDLQDNYSEWLKSYELEAISGTIAKKGESVVFRQFDIFEEMKKEEANSQKYTKTFVGKIKIGDIQDEALDVAYSSIIDLSDGSYDFKYLKIGETYYKTEELEEALKAPMAKV